jgi:CDP-glucose 4,6-dehydratase
VLVTGHTGFKGSWLTCYLVELGAEVMGVSLPGPVSVPSLWDSLRLSPVRDLRADIAGDEWQQRAVEFGPRVVIHAAAQAIVGVGYDDPLTTFRTNTLGTVNVMALLASLPDLEAALVITTDKVYDTRQAPPYDESQYLGGSDPYAASKAAADLVTTSWPPTSGRAVVARAGNVIGGGDWSADRIVPDLVRSWASGAELALRRPAAVRPWQHVIEPLVGYLAYCEAVARADSVPRALNFGPGSDDAVSVGELVEFAAGAWSGLAGGGPPAWRVDAPPEWASKEVLGIENRWGWQEAVRRTLEWYVRSARGEDPRELVLEQFAAYQDRR